MNAKEGDLVTLDEKVEREIEKNPELRKIFEKHPERKELYKQKILDSEHATFGCKKINPKFCKMCIFSKGDPPFEDRPEKAYCMIYSREQGVGKPYDVYYEGGLCEFYNDGKEDDVT